MGTVEFFPEEGKYHYDGHRKCEVCLTPEEAEKMGNICPVCGKKLTMGVEHRVEQLADRKYGYRKENAKEFESLVPLAEVISSCMGYSSGSKKVQSCYENMLEKLGPEFEILRRVPAEDIKAVSDENVAAGIEGIRQKKVKKIPGFDGKYGKILF